MVCIDVLTVSALRWWTSNRYNNSQTVDEIKLALQAGFRSIDTAFDYGDEVGGH